MEELNMNLEEQPVTFENTPRPFAEIPRLWLQVGRMTETFFSQELPHADARNTIFSILVYTGLSTILSVIHSILSGIIKIIGGSTDANTPEFASTIGIATIFLCCFVLILAPISFYLNNGILYVGALVFGGKGKFTGQAYLNSLFLVPLGLIASLAGFVSLIPEIGAYILSVVLLGITIFNIIFTVRSMKVVHGLTTGRAVAAVLLPFILLLIPICLIGLLTMMGPMVGNVFSSINSSLGTPAP
jgi:hypothetical protein